MLQQPLQNEFGYCERDADGKVVNQNELCEKICGPKLDRTCHLCDMEDRGENNPYHTMNYKKYHIISKRMCQVTQLKTKDRQAIIFYPLNNEINKLRERLKKSKLTDQEMEVASLMLIGNSNNDILNKLTITKATLKTHINHIYKKAPFLKGLR